jgi:Cys-tRNA(Pro)/Cys-tRNA(Cys) deacylase
VSKSAKDAPGTSDHGSSKRGASKHAEHASTPAVAALLAADIPHTLHTYDHDPDSDLSYGLEAAQAIGIDPAQVFKTLCVYADGALAMGVVPVDQMLDLKAVAHALGAKKAQMASPADAERVTGYVVGGISPIGGRKRLPLVLDKSAQMFAEIYVSGGRRGFDIGIAPTDLVAVTGGSVAPVAKPN